MVSLNHLEALDLLVWLGTTERAADLAASNQSTISRRSRTALQTLGLRMGRGRVARGPFGDNSLLNLERQVHQQARFLGSRPLRLQIPYWSRCRVLPGQPEGWCANPDQPALVCENPVTLLRDRVIDACLLTPTQVPQAAGDLLLMELYHRPIELTVLMGGAPHTSHPRCWRSLRQRQLRLQLQPFLPRSCCRRSSEWFQALIGSEPTGDGMVTAAPDQDAEAISVAFLTPEMRQAQDRPFWVAESVPPHPYVERLAVLAENAGEPALQRLQEHLHACFTPLLLAA